ncbi:MAG: amino acid adenylation domain-containing protein [Oscillatoriales cyanobacterium RM2_1_1]|nr:amino acid adenylation domain-containing protein [Oscillatoriales cyanobacterium SM2_3_0]NJO44401.1 amino acid adenylation domain-containing protein [Oscillatoriales cyanobacterium RM2_1_1]
MTQSLFPSISLPLTPIQQSNWFLYQLSPRGIRDKLALALQALSQIDQKKIRQVFQILVSRHPSLRTMYREQDNQVIQVIQPQIALNFQEINFSDLSQVELENAISILIEQPFQLSENYPFRVQLLHCSGQFPVLLITLHQLAGDWESLLILTDEFLTLYHSSLEEPEIDFQNFDFMQSDRNYREQIDRQLSSIASLNFTESEIYWRQKLTGELPGLRLPFTLSTALRTYNGSSYQFLIDQELTENLRHLSSRYNIDLEVLLLAIYKVLLHLYTREEDIIVGRLISGKIGQSEKLIGNFLNAILLRDWVSGDMSFEGILAQVSQTLRESLPYQNYPFSKLVQTHQSLQISSQNLSQIERSSLCQGAFAYSDISSLGYVFQLFEGDQSLEFKYLELPTQKLEFDFSLEFIPFSDRLLVYFKYNQDSIPAQTAQKFSQHFQNLLRSVCENPQKPIDQLSILSEAEKQTILVEWNQTARDYDLSKPLQYWFELQAKNTPNATALIFRNQTLTYSQLNQLANQLAHYLTKSGVKSETLVGVCIERSVEMVVSLLGILKAGAAYVPLDPEHPPERLAYVLEDMQEKDTQVPLVLVGKPLSRLFPQDQTRIIDWNEIWQKIRSEPEDNPGFKTMPQSLAYVIYTSGSTGKPKGVMNTHQGICNRLFWMQETYQLDPTDRILQKTPYSFDVSVWEIFWPLISGACLVIAKPQGHKDSRYLTEIIVEQQITTLHFVPSMLQIFLEEDLLEEDLTACQSLRRVICSGEALSLSLQAQFFQRLNCQLYNLYGPTEAAIDVTAWHCQANSTLSCVPIGKPIANTQIYILNSGLQPVPLGVSGELYIGGIQVAQGYLNRPELTAERFIANPYTSGFLYKTGDLVRYLPDGNIEYLNRLDYQVKIRGFRIELGEIEHSLTQHPQIREAIVIAQNNPSAEKQLVAYLVPVRDLKTQDQQSESLTPEELRNFLRHQLPDYIVPSAFVILDAIPLTSNGKVNRQALPQPTVIHFRTQPQLIPPRNHLEVQLVRIWQDLLNVNPVSIKDNFFELGGHSLLAIQLLGKIQQHLNCSLALTNLLTHPTVEALANLLKNSPHSMANSPLVSIQPQGQQEPFFCIHPAGGHVLCYVNLARYLGNSQPFYGLQAQGFAAGEIVLETVEAMANLYVNAIRQFKPEGPYQIGGWSFGGVVAYEVAQQLAQQGQTVSHLAILDSYVPILLDKNKQIDDTYLVGVLSRVFGGMFGLDNLVTPEELQDLTTTEKLNFIIEKSRQVGIFPPEVEHQQNHRILNVLVGTLKATYDYQRQPYSGKVTVFRAREKHIMAADPQLVWVELFSILDAVEIEVINIPGDHYSFILEPHVQELAQKLGQFLAQVQD